MKVIIAGSRGISDYPAMEYAIQESGLEITEVVSGGAKGVDSLGEMWAIEYTIPISKFPAKWWEHGKRAGHIRNAEMAAYADALIAIWDGGSPGTRNMIYVMQKKGKPAYVYVPTHEEKVNE